MRNQVYKTYVTNINPSMKTFDYYLVHDIQETKDDSLQLF